jgi:hypothetical protein
MPGILDRARLELFIQRLDYHLSDLPRDRRRLIRGELRANIHAAAAEVGVGQSVANLGRPSVLAAGYAAAEGRPLPRYRTGAWWAGGALVLYVWLLLVYAMGFSDGGEAASGLARHIDTSFLGASIQANGGAKSLSVSFSAYVLLLPAVVFLLASRSWRALPPVRRRLAAGASATSTDANLTEPY